MVLNQKLTFEDDEASDLKKAKRDMGAKSWEEFYLTLANIMPHKKRVRTDGL
jgi:hypothetical protein